MTPSALQVDVRVVPGLPRDGLGRVPPAQLLALFGRGPDGALRSPSLAVERVGADAEGARFAVSVPRSYRWFDGHFDEYPVMPAAVQLGEIVVPCARRAGLLHGDVARFARLKFSRRIQPGMTLTVCVRRARDGIRFEIEGEAGLLSSGRLVPREDGERSRRARPEEP